MPDFSTLAGGAAESAADASTTKGISVADASTDTKGSWVELLASTAYPTAWMLVTVESLTSSDAFLIDIGVGASTAEKVLIPDLNFDESSLAPAPIMRSWLFPISIPAGTRLSARCASSTSGADAVTITLVLIAATMASTPGFGRVEGFGANTTGSTGTSIDPGTSANTEGAWVELIAATSHAYQWMCIAMSGNAVATTTYWLIDIGVGANPNEKVVIPNLFTKTGTTADMPALGTYCFPVSIPAGSRVSVRCQCNVNTATERLLFISGQGVG